MTPVFRHGALRLYLLKLLGEQPRHGYEVISLLEDRFLGLYAPSAGTVYPRLQRLDAEGLVEHQEVEGRKVYRLTEAGREELARNTEELASLEHELTQSISDMARDVRQQVRASVRDLRVELKQAAREVRREARSDARAQRTSRTADPTLAALVEELRQLVSEHSVTATDAAVSSAAASMRRCLKEVQRAFTAAGE